MTENGSATMNKPTVNGDAPHSQTLDVSPALTPPQKIPNEPTLTYAQQHVTSYPLVSDLLQFYQNNSLGAKSIQAIHSIYHTFAEPVVPYLQTPYSIAHPYLQRADSFGDESLTTIDNHFPALKSTNYEKLKSGAVSVAYYPFEVAGKTKNYVFTTYEDESKKVGGEGVVAFGKSVVSTELRIVSEAMQATAEFIKPKKDALEEKYEEAKKAGSQQAHRAKKVAQDKADQMANSY